MSDEVEHVERYLTQCLDCPPGVVGGLWIPNVFTVVNDAAAYAGSHAEAGAHLGVTHRVIVTNAVMVHCPREET